MFHEDSPDKYALVETVKTQAGARTMAIDRKTGRAFLSAGESGPPQVPTPGGKQFRGAMVPGSFSVLVFGESSWASTMRHFWSGL